MERVRKEWIRAWQKVMLDYDESVYQELSSPDNQEFLKLLRKYIREGCLILEAGCGYGHKCMLFNKYYKASVVGLDIVLEPLKALNEPFKQKLQCRICSLCCGWRCNEVALSWQHL